MPSRLAVICLDALQPRVVADFWCAVLDWVVMEEDVDGIGIGIGIGIAPVAGTGPRIDVFQVLERKTVKNRLHLDLALTGRARRTSWPGCSRLARPTRTSARVLTSPGRCWRIRRATSSAC